MVKTPEQIEAGEIIERLEKEFGLNRAEIGRQLGKLSRGYIGMLAKGQRTAAPRTLQQLRDLLAKAIEAHGHGHSIKKRSDELEDLQNRLALMERGNRPNFEVVKRVIESMSPTPPPKPAANSAPEPFGLKVLKRGLASKHKPGGDRPA